MKTNCKLALAVLAGVLISIAGARLIHAQQVKRPPAYVIAEVEVTDPVTLKKYSEKAPQIVASFDGHYVIRGGKIEALEGEAPKGFIVVIGFDSVEKARAWYDSPDYAVIRPFAKKNTGSTVPHPPENYSFRRLIRSSRGHRYRLRRQLVLVSFAEPHAEEPIDQ